MTHKAGPVDVFCLLLSVSDMPAAASVHSAKDEECYLPFSNDFVPKKVQSAAIPHTIKETSLVFNAVHTCLDLEQPASELSKVNSLGSLNSHQPVKTFPATCFVWLLV